MKTQRIKTLSVLAIALFMLTASNSYAQRGGRGYAAQDRDFDRNQPCRMIPDLTEDQETKIEALRIAHLKEMNPYRNQLNELRAKKHTLMTSDNADVKEINSVIDQMSSIHNKMMKATAKHHQDVRNLLTDEQKVYFDSRPMRGHGQGRGMRNAQGARCDMGGYGRGFNRMQDTGD